MIFPWAHVLISAGAHGLRRIPGQSVNLAHLIWRAPRAPAPLQGAPPVVFRAGLWVLGITKKRCHPGRRQPIRDLVPQSPMGSPLSASLRRG